MSNEPQIDMMRMSMLLEEDSIAVSRALQGLDTMMFLGFFNYFLAQTSTEDPNSPVFSSFISTVCGAIIDVSKMRLGFLADGRLELLRGLPNIYEAMMYKLFAVLRDESAVIDAIKATRTYKKYVNPPTIVKAFAFPRQTEPEKKVDKSSDV
jgi:hypothetical protein